MMRILLTITLFAALASPAAAQDRQPRVGELVRAAIAAEFRAERQGPRRQEGREQVERTTRVLKVGANGELHISNVSGDIVINRGSGNEVSLEIVKTARGRDDADTRELLELVQVEVIERNNRAEVRTRYPQGDEMRRNNRRNFNVSVAYNVTAPAGIRIRAYSVSGSVTAKDIKGDVSAESVSGAVRLISSGRVSSAKSISGDVEVVDATIDGPLSASTASGNVMLRRVKARELELQSVSGDVVLDDIQAERVEAQTVSGSVRFSGPVARSGRYEFNSHSGNVTLAVAGTQGFELEATSFSGSIRSDFTFSGDSAESSGRGRWQKTIRGVYGDGSAGLELTTFSGNIVITKR